MQTKQKQKQNFFIWYGSPLTHAPHHALSKKTKKKQRWPSFHGIRPLGVQRHLSPNAKKVVPFSHVKKKTFLQKEGGKTRHLHQGSGRTGGSLQMNRLSLRNNRLKLETSRELPIILEESIEHTSNE